MRQCIILAHVDQLDQVVELVEAYPDLTYLVDHFSHGDPNESPSESAFARYADLAEFDTTHPKVSEMQHNSKAGFPYEAMHDHV